MQWADELTDKAPEFMKPYIPNKNDIRLLCIPHQNRALVFQAKAGDDIPDRGRPFLGKKFVAVKTCGDGACALHAVLGSPTDANELRFDDARANASCLLGPSYDEVVSRFGHNNLLESIAVSLWSELMVPYLEGCGEQESRISSSVLRG